MASLTAAENTLNQKCKNLTLRFCSCSYRSSTVAIRVEALRYVASTEGANSWFISNGSALFIAWVKYRLWSCKSAIFARIKYGMVDKKNTRTDRFHVPSPPTLSAWWGISVLLSCFVPLIMMAQQSLEPIYPTQGYTCSQVVEQYLSWLQELARDIRRRSHSSSCDLSEVYQVRI